MVGGGVACGLQGMLRRLAAIFCSSFYLRLGQGCNSQWAELKI